MSALLYPKFNWNKGHSIQEKWGQENFINKCHVNHKQNKRSHNKKIVNVSDAVNKQPKCSFASHIIA
jgi:hypothetical protein